MVSETRVEPGGVVPKIRVPDHSSLDFFQYESKPERFFSTVRIRSITVVLRWGSVVEYLFAL